MIVNPKTQPMWTSDRDVFTDKDGNIVDPTDPSCAFQVVVKGGQMLLSKAQELGLIKQPEAPAKAEEKAQKPEADKAETPKADKAVKPASNKGK